MIYLTYGHILQESGALDGDAIEVAASMVWSEIATSEQSIRYATHIDTIDGVGIYYDYAADYYFFTDETGEQNEPPL
jgi:hypothetical protein